MLNNYFLDFIEFYVIYFIVFFFFNYLLVKTLKFFIKNLIGYDLWTYVDDSFRLCPNNTSYDISTNTYILDYEYIDISEMIYYHDNFLDPTLELKYHFDLFPETKNREDDDHELYGLMSTYIIPLHYKYYILEHYWPEDEKPSLLFPNFHDFKDLDGEFKFIYDDYKKLWPKYEKCINSREIFYKEKLYNSKIIQFYFYKKFHRYLKAPLSYWLMLHNKECFWKKEYRTFDLIEPSQELCKKKYMTWFLLKLKYDEAKFEYDVFCNLSPYEVFDSVYYAVSMSPENNLIDMETKRHQFIENKDEYFFEFINSENLMNYYFNVNLMAKYNKKRFRKSKYEYDLPSDPFDYLFFIFVDRVLLMIGYLFMFYFCCFTIFWFFVCYYCWYHHIYSFDFELYIDYIRMLTRNKNYNDYNDYKFLIFNYTKNDINIFFYNENIKIELERNCTRDRNKFLF